MLSSTNKTELRKTLRQQRRALDSVAITAKSQNTVQILSTLEIFQKSQHIAFYLPNDHEVDISILPSLHPEKNYYLPVLTAKKALFFKRYHASDTLENNALGIPEPTHGELLDAKKIDLLCMPLVGFDKEGHRLGMGGGYYDRTFSFKRHEPNSKPYLLGIAYEFQEIENIPHNHWDVSLDGILTEQGFRPRVHR